MTDLTYAQLKKAVADFEKDVTRTADSTRGNARQIEEEAEDTARVAEMIGGMGVDNETIGETRDLSRLMNGVREAAIEYAAAGDNTAKAAKAAADQAHRTHGGVAEAVSRAPVDRIQDVHRDWFRQD